MDLSHAFQVPNQTLQNLIIYRARKHKARFEKGVCLKCCMERSVVTSSLRGALMSSAELRPHVHSIGIFKPECEACGALLLPSCSAELNVLKMIEKMTGKENLGFNFV